VQFGGFF